MSKVRLHNNSSDLHDFCRKQFEYALSIGILGLSDAKSRIGSKKQMIQQGLSGMTRLMISMRSSIYGDNSLRYYATQNVSRQKQLNDYNHNSGRSLMSSIIQNTARKHSYGIEDMLKEEGLSKTFELSDIRPGFPMYPSYSYENIIEEMYMDKVRWAYLKSRGQ